MNNPLNRYSISARQNLKSNPDGSTDLYIQNEFPGKDKESNWLPAPPGDFILMLRLYWPNEKSPSIINGRGNSAGEDQVRLAPSILPWGEAPGSRR